MRNIPLSSTCEVCGGKAPEHIHYGGKSFKIQLRKGVKNAKKI